MSVAVIRHDQAKTCVTLGSMSRGRPRPERGPGRQSRDPVDAGWMTPDYINGFLDDDDNDDDPGGSVGPTGRREGPGAELSGIGAAERTFQALSLTGAVAVAGDHEVVHSYQLSHGDPVPSSDAFGRWF